MNVLLTSDGVLIVQHDETVDRTTNGSGALTELTYAEVAALDNAYWFTPDCGVCDDQPAEDDDRAVHEQRGRRAREPDREDDEYDGGGDERGVLGGERRMDPGAHRTGEDHDIAAHRTITVPRMSCEWSVHTYS